MISDEELKAVSGVDVNLILKNYCLVFKIPQAEAEAAMGPVMRAQEMAQELLQRREAERNAKSWENAPEWAQYRITTHEGIQRYFENDPTPDDFGDFYSEGGRISIIMVDNWEDSVEERPR